MDWEKWVPKRGGAAIRREMRKRRSRTTCSRRFSWIGTGAVGCGRRERLGGRRGYMRSGGSSRAIGGSIMRGRAVDDVFEWEEEDAVSAFRRVFLSMWRC